MNWTAAKIDNFSVGRKEDFEEEIDETVKSFNSLRIIFNEEATLRC